MSTPFNNNMQSTREATDSEAHESFMKSVASQVLAHWEVGYKIHNEEATQMRAWIMEVVKHLAIINVAGLAGVVTLMATQINNPTNNWYFKFLPFLFVLGLISAVLDMYLNSRGHLKRVEEMRRRIDELRDLYKNSSLHLLKNLRENIIEAPFDNRIWFTAAEYCGWISAISFILGMIGIYGSLAKCGI